MAAIKEVAVNYGSFDRAIHRIAFKSEVIRSTALDMENALFKSRFAHVKADRPIFITSLPRAGTTLLLELFHGSPAVATHTYRDMPFVFAPILWHRLSRAFRRRAELHERAHADGMTVGFDSPEAFEEILWQMLWPGKTESPRLSVWTKSDQKTDAVDFLEDHMRKIIALRRPERTAGVRYLSKNNSNIRRLELIPHMFPDASVLVPFRRPLEHAASLLRQHEHFLDVHREEPFAREYMEDLGHFEFGELHRPIAFPALDGLAGESDTDTMDYWLGYWIAAFEHILGKRENVILVSYEAICEAPQAALARICRKLGIAGEEVSARAASLVRPPPPARRADFQASPALLERAVELHRRLLADQLLS